eukprot:1577052-Rhodomonas_salina.1
MEARAALIPASSKLSQLMHVQLERGRREKRLHWIWNALSEEESESKEGKGCESPASQREFSAVRRRYNEKNSLLVRLGKEERILAA